MEGLTGTLLDMDRSIKARYMLGGNQSNKNLVPHGPRSILNYYLKKEEKKTCKGSRFRVNNQD